MDHIDLGHQPSWEITEPRSFVEREEWLPDDIAESELRVSPLALEYADVDFTIEEIDDGSEALSTLDASESLTRQLYPKCPGPTPWRIARQQVVVSRWIPVSAAVYAKTAPIRHTFRVNRTVTWAATIESGYKASLVLAEAQVGVKLETRVTIGTSETLSYVVPKGMTMCLFAAAGLVRRTIIRTAYGSAMCNAVPQSFVVSSPYRTIIKADRA